MPTKVWVAGEEVLAADFNPYVQEQVVATFATAAARNTAIPAPKAGQMSYLADSKRTEQWNGTAWTLPWTMPWGRLAWAEMTANVNASTPTDLMTLNVATAPPAGRLIRVGVHVNVVWNANAGIICYFNQVGAAGGSGVWIHAISPPATPVSAQSTVNAHALVTIPTAGAYKIQGGPWTGGAGTSWLGDANQQRASAWLEDIGPAS
jgi:hypothetical protein